MFDKGAYVVRGGDHKLLIERKGGATQLFNLRENIGESKNLADVNSEKLGALEKLRVEWDSQLVPPVFEGLRPSDYGKPGKKRADAKSND